MPSDYFLHQVIQSEQHFQVFDFSNINFSSCCASNVISKTFTWLLLNRSSKTCLALQCVRVVVCSTAFYHESNVTFEKFLLKSWDNVFLGNF